jgi:beta-glucosidase
VEFDRSGAFDGMADVGVAVVAEEPYAEGLGDREDLTLTDGDVTLIEQMRARCNRLIVIVISGRPLILTEQLPKIDGLVAAWLPGTEGAGVADVLFGDYPFTGKLPYSWPHSMSQIPMPTEGDSAPLFPFGYGLEVEK